MIKKQHDYKITLKWTGNRGNGTKDYRSYERSHTISIDGKRTLEASSDQAFRGDNKKYNPEELLVSSLASCHMLWYLHLCSEASIVVTDYTDTAIGIMKEMPSGSGYFSDVILNPIVTVSEISMIETANTLHHKANKMCFIANSVNFPVTHKPSTIVSD